MEPILEKSVHKKFELTKAEKPQACSFTFPQSSLAQEISAGHQWPLEYYKKAIDEFEQVNDFKQHADNRKRITVTEAYLLRNAKVLLDHEEFALAQNLLIKVLTFDPYNKITIQALAECFFKQKQFDSALRCYQQLVRVYNDIGDLVRLAEVYYITGNDEQALRLYSQAMERITVEIPLLFDIYKNTGNIYVRLGDFDAAEENYNKAHTLCPRSDALLVNFGTLEIQRDNLNAALERFRESVQINSKNDKGWVGLALVHFHFGDWQLARGNLECALDVNPVNKTALQLLADWAIRYNFCDIAALRLENALSIENIDGELSFLLVKTYINLGRINQAQIELARTLAIDPLNQEAESLLEAINSH